MSEASDIDAGTRGRLVGAAREAAGRAYVPYSNFPVGAAVLTDDGSVVTGCNVENASYGLTCCAERVAAFTAAAAGHRTFRAVAVTAPAATRASPCGACRQVLREFVPAGGMLVLLDGVDGVEETDLATLLPDSFGPEDLGG
ncbi:MAG: cytidine deaminase [Chloroflexia bacterium]|nr:cytidine deaminase [Chloroflexia bacterium]MDQ3513483.1 cytidine deaminase [Chloroflexota bacterium]